MRRIAFASALLLGALAASASASATKASPTRTVVLTVSQSRFSATELTVKRGETVRFVVRNTDPIDHELIIGPKSTHDRHESGREAWHPPVPGEVSVPLFAEASTTYTFTERGTTLFGCHLPGHWDYGMVGRVEVT